MSRIISLIYYLISLIFLLFIFFPYISFYDFGTDTQPYALFFGVLIFLFTKKVFIKIHISILVLFIWALFILIFSGFDFTAIRSFLNYASLFFISYSSYYLLKNRSINFEFFFKIVLIVWFVIGFIQTFYSRNFLTFLVSSSRTTDDRGVTSLAPEATFYGVIFIFFILILIHSSFKYKFFYILLSCIGIIFLAKSSMAFLFLILMFFLYVILYVKIKYILLILFFAFFVVPYLYIGDGSRLTNLIKIFLENPSSIVLIDASINDRVFHVFFSIKGFFDNFLLPNGYLSWNNYVIKELPNYSNLVMIDNFSANGRIMSGYGAAFFELGIIALIIPFVLFRLLRSIYFFDNKKFLFFFIYVNLIMFSAIQIGFTFFSFYIAYLAYLNHINSIPLINES
jgi:hypothetical protein